jgi:hypothetical protein
MKMQMFATLDKANPDTGNIRGLNLAAVKHTTVQVKRCVLNKNRTLGNVQKHNNCINTPSSQTFRSRDSVVGLATNYGLDDRGVEVRVPVGSKIFFSPRRPDWPRGPPSLLSNRYRGPFPRG